MLVPICSLGKFSTNNGDNVSGIKILRNVTKDDKPKYIAEQHIVPVDTRILWYLADFYGIGVQIEAHNVGAMGKSAMLAFIPARVTTFNRLELLSVFEYMDDIDPHFIEIHQLKENVCVIPTKINAIWLDADTLKDAFHDEFPYAPSDFVNSLIPLLHES